MNDRIEDVGDILDEARGLCLVYNKAQREYQVWDTEWSTYVMSVPKPHEDWPENWFFDTFNNEHTP